MQTQPDAFRDYVAGRSARLLKTAWLLTGDWHLAEDLLQTALAKTSLAWHRIERHENVDAYVRRAMVTTYASWWRRKWRGETPTELLPDRLTSADAFTEVDLRESVRRALVQLPARQRAVVVLRYFEDLSEADTAAALGCSVGAVKSHASRALARLRESSMLSALVNEEAM
ncbi:MAG: SigE family RNA polymerase sigma factor [Actinomycetes bacterium]